METGGSTQTKKENEENNKEGRSFFFFFWHNIRIEFNQERSGILCNHDI